ncbi:MAG: hypothetical protein HYZ17_14110 [Betaproteobacteria bacterium]|nr:hypothetical protein [Betaproteobacteria bacterium]
MNTIVKAALVFFGAAPLAAALAGAWSFRRDLAHARARLSGTSQVIASPYGETEFSQGGEVPLGPGSDIYRDATNSRAWNLSWNFSTAQASRAFLAAMATTAFQ